MSNKKTRPGNPAPVGDTLEVPLLAAVKASFELVRRAERDIILAARAGGDAGRALEVHHLLRTGSLGLLRGYSLVAGLPDPIESEALQEALTAAGPRPEVVETCEHQWVDDGPITALPALRCTVCGHRPR